MAEERPGKQQNNGSSAAQSEGYQKPITLILERAPFGTANDYLILSEDNRYLGSTKAEFDKRDRGRPIEDDNRVAILLAFKLAESRGMAIQQARIWAGRQLGLGNRGQSADRTLERSIRARLKDKGTTELINNCKMLIADFGDNNETLCLMLKPGFTFSIESGALRITGDGWRWRPGEGQAQHGHIDINRSNRQFEYIDNKEREGGG